VSICSFLSVVLSGPWAAIPAEKTLTFCNRYCQRFAVRMFVRQQDHPRDRAAAVTGATWLVIV
jgi:hypothetical protein